MVLDFEHPRDVLVQRASNKSPSRSDGKPNSSSNLWGGDPQWMSLSFSNPPRVSDDRAAIGDVLMMPAHDLETKLEMLRDFLDNSGYFSVTQSRVDTTAANIARLLAAHGDNPYRIVDYTGATPQDILAPDQTWGSITPIGSESHSSEEFMLELHNPQGRLELLLAGDEKEIMLLEIAAYRSKRF